MKIELMSPAGNLKSFIAAIEGGADSIYLGLKKFNARRPAQNFSIYQLKKALNFAHKNSIKIYLALNIDLKSSELYEAAQILILASLLKIDGIITKDPAILYFTQKFFPNNIGLHFSTQAAISSSYGIKFAKSQNIKRVVLAREMTLEEIKEACKIEGVDCEIFVEGSMCFSASGRCLMSSWAGGKSGNRGLCAAPCRVTWKNKSNKVFTFFSMKDLSLINDLEKIINTGVKCLKIEGRLKNPKWVKEITEFYRNAINNIDNKTDLDSLYKKLEKYSARERSSGHLLSHKNLIGLNSTWGNYEKFQEDNTIVSEFADNNYISFKIIDNKLEVIIKLFNKKNTYNIKIPDPPKKAKLVKFENIESFLKNENFKDLEFKITYTDLTLQLSSSSISNIASTITTYIKDLIKNEETLPKLDDSIINFINTTYETPKRSKLLGDYPDKIIISSKDAAKFFDTSIPIKTIVIPLDNQINLATIKRLRSKYDIILSAPSILYENEISKLIDHIKNFSKTGFDKFEANSYTGIEILKDFDCKKYLGIGMPIMNHLAARYFYNLGFLSVYPSIEGDSSIYKSLCMDINNKSLIPSNIECLVFGKIPLFHSRVDSPEFTKDAIFKDNIGIEIECHKENEISMFVSQKPLSLIGSKVKDNRIYFDSLTADLRFFNDPIRVFNSILNDKFANIESSAFNFFNKLS